MSMLSNFIGPIILRKVYKKTRIRSLSERWNQMCSTSQSYQATLDQQSVTQDAPLWQLLILLCLMLDHTENNRMQRGLNITYLRCLSRQFCFSPPLSHQKATPQTSSCQFLCWVCPVVITLEWQPTLDWYLDIGGECDRECSAPLLLMLFPLFVVPVEPHRLPWVMCLHTAGSRAILYFLLFWYGFIKYRHRLEHIPPSLLCQWCNRIYCTLSFWDIVSGCRVWGYLFPAPLELLPLPIIEQTPV